MPGVIMVELPAQLINRRENIMIESAAYAIIEERGWVLNAREMLLEAIMVKFETVPDDISAAIQELTDRNTLKALLRQAITCSDIELLRNKVLAAAS